jgi:hypothetical protein
MPVQCGMRSPGIPPKDVVTMDPLPSISLAAKLIAGLALVALLALLLVFGPRYCSSLKGAAAQGKVDSAEANGQVQAAKDATGITANTMSDAQAIDQQTRTNDENIQKSAGAGVAVAPGVDDAGRRALCLRRAYRDQPSCVALLNAHPVATGG